jgi:hypothetical protein
MSKTTMDLKKLKKPESKGVLPAKPKRGRKAGRKLTECVQVRLTEPEMDKIVALADEQGTSYSQTVRTLLKKGGHI